MFNFKHLFFVLVLFLIGVGCGDVPTKINQGGETIGKDFFMIQGNPSDANIDSLYKFKFDTDGTKRIEGVRLKNISVDAEQKEDWLRVGVSGRKVELTGTPTREDFARYAMTIFLDDGTSKTLNFSVKVLE